MTLCAFQLDQGRDLSASGKSTTANKPDLSYLPTFNDVGGRPTERQGSRGSFTPGVRIMSGDRSRNVPLETEINRGTVLFAPSTLKPNMSGEALNNKIGGRPTERLGSRGRFAPGERHWSGGAPRDMPLEADIHRGTVTFSSSTLKPDMSSEARTNAFRPTERLGSGGRFAPGASRRWSGGQPRDVRLPREHDHGTVIFESSRFRPDLSKKGETNVSGGRETERHGRIGSFAHGVVEVAGGPLSMPPRDGAARWWEAGQKPENRFRRCGSSHFVAGVSILSGGAPLY